MKFSRSVLHGVLGVIAFIAILGAGMNACADRLSKQLDKVDITYEEVFK